MYGYMKLTCLEMTVVVVHQGVHFFDSLNFLWIGLHTYFAEYGAVECDLGHFIWQFLLLNTRLLLLATWIKWRLVLCSFSKQPYMHKLSWIHRTPEHLSTVWPSTFGKHLGTSSSWRAYIWSGMFLSVYWMLLRENFCMWGVCSKIHFSI